VTEKGVAAAWDESQSWQAQRRLPEALSAARRAAELAAGGEAAETLRQQADTRLAELRLLDQLENVSLERASVAKDDPGGQSHFDDELADALYRQVFQRAGIDVEDTPVPEVGERIRAMSVAVEVAAVLDAWAHVRLLMHGPTDAKRKQILQVARATDPDLWRGQLRAALEQNDVRLLRELAASEEVFRSLPATQHALASALLKEGAAGQALALLREAQRRRPDDFWINAFLAALLHHAQPPDIDWAICFYTAALAVRPQSAGTRLNLGVVLLRKGRSDDAIAQYRAAIRLNENYALAHNNLGNALSVTGQLDDALAEYQKAIELNPESAIAHYNLGLTFRRKGQLDKAIAEYREAIRIRPDYQRAHTNLGFALVRKGRHDEALDEFREAVKLNNDDPMAHHNLGVALHGRGQVDKAIAQFRKALRLKADDPQTHSMLGSALNDKGLVDEALVECQAAIRLAPNNPGAYLHLGIGLMAKGKLDDAITAFRTVTRLKPDLAEGHNNLGVALEEKRQLKEAIAAYREAIRLNPGYATAHKNLGVTLRNQGHFVEALKHLRRSYELQGKNPRGNGASAELVKHCERLVELDGKLPAVLRGQERPANAREQAEYAQVCLIKRQYISATRLYREAIAAQPDVVESPANGLRYNAACAAALAGCGQGPDAATLNDKERSQYRRQALEWLKDELQAWKRFLEKGPQQAGPTVSQQLRHWLQDPDLGGVRGSEVLSKLPQDERQSWQQLWTAVADTLARSRGDATPKKKADTK
jgi:tetratricopeptide (TPR) repeat protein